MKRILGIKTVRKHRVAIGIVRNRVRTRSRSADHLETVTAELGIPDIGEIRDRALYTEVASTGLGIFDLPTPRIEAIQSDWYPLIRYVETAGWQGQPT